MYGLTTPTERAEQGTEQRLGIVQLGRTAPKLDVVLEAGYASGDSNGEDAIQRRGTIDPDHRVGLVLFPEVLSAFTARAAALSQDPSVSARPARGGELLPTNGGVSGAAYVLPYALWRPLGWLEARLGAVLAHRTLTDGLVLSGVLFPGGAFENAAGETLAPLGLVRLRVGLRYR